MEAFSDPEIIQPPGSAPFKVVLANLPTTVTMPHAIPGVKLVTFKSGMGRMISALIHGQPVQVGHGQRGAHRCERRESRTG